MKLRLTVIVATGMLWAFGASAGASVSAEALFKEKCVSCHITGRPVDFSKLVAPPVMGVMRHVKMQYPNKEEAVAFIKEYTLDPQEAKAVCMPQKIKRFGLMPSQKGNVTAEELERIGAWMFDNFPSVTAAGGKACGNRGCNTGKKACAPQKKGRKAANQQPAKRAPFLVSGLMPHMTKLLMRNWESPELALTPEQKTELLQVRKETMGGVKALSPKVRGLEREIAARSASGEGVENIMPLVEKLAALKSEATRVHLECIYRTKQVLTPEQLAFLLR